MYLVGVSLKRFYNAIFGFNGKITVSLKGEDRSLYDTNLLKTVVTCFLLGFQNIYHLCLQTTLIQDFIFLTREKQK